MPDTLPDTLKHITFAESIILQAAKTLLSEIAERLMDASYATEGTGERRLIVASCAAEHAQSALANALISFQVRLAVEPEPAEPQSLRA